MKAKANKPRKERKPEATATEAPDFERLRKSATLDLRLPVPLLAAIKVRAHLEASDTINLSVGCSRIR